MLIIFVLMAGIATATECQISPDNITFTDITDSMYGGVISEADSLARVGFLNASTDYCVRCRNTTTGWGYDCFTTSDAGGGDMSQAISITLFMLLVTGTLFYLGVSARAFSKVEITNFILKKMCLINAIFLMTLNSAIIATIADSAGYGINNEIFTYTYLLSWSGYALMIYLMFTTLIKALKMWKLEKRRRRTGE